MFVLIIDNSKIFSDNIEDYIVHYAFSSKAALQFLEENFLMISEIWLDYNLSENDTVVPVINWLKEKGDKGEINHLCCIRILTNNPVGAQKIAILGRYFFIGLTPQHIGIRE